MTTKYLQYIEKRLHDWADWFSKDHLGLGYPSSSMEYKLMMQMPKENKNYHGNICTNEDAEEIELLVNEMAELNSNMALALRCYYFTSGGLRMKAQKMNMSHMHYKNYVDMPHQWLIGRLSSYSKYKKMMKNS